MKKLLSVLALGIGLSGASHAATFTETFDYPGFGTQDEALRTQGWCGGNAGDLVCNNPPGTLENQGGEGAISFGNGQDGTQGFAFWSQTRIFADSFMYTQSYSFQSDDLLSLSWYQRDSGSDPMHLAFQIGSNWYISDQTFIQPDSTTWVLQSVDLTDLTFFLRAIGDPTLLPDGGVVAGGASLASGLVESWGFWWDGPKTATSRIDSVTVTTSAVPLPAAAWLLLAGVGGLAATARRKRGTA